MKPSAALANGGGGGDDEDDEQKNSDHFEGDPRPLPYAFEKELIENSNRHIRICESFGPSNRGRFSYTHTSSCHLTLIHVCRSFHSPSLSVYAVSGCERDRILMLFIDCFQFIPSLPSSMPKPNYMHLRRRSGTTTTTTTNCPRITHCSSRRYTAGYRCSVGRLLAI